MLIDGHARVKIGAREYKSTASAAPLHGPRHQLRLASLRPRDGQKGSAPRIFRQFFLKEELLLAVRPRLDSPKDRVLGSDWLSGPFRNQNFRVILPVIGDASQPVEPILA